MAISRFRGARARYIPGKQNKTEQAYCAYLERLRSVGAIKEYFFECVKLKINSNCFYCPDFMVITRDDFVEFHEVKGGRGRVGSKKPYYEDDAMVKMKAVSDKYPFRFMMVWQDGSEWKSNEI